ncbi:HNH endonuclease [Nocardia uniformis]|uniref:HNH endonuclease n=1 Tax=Nocardia uniformis TaxID=53432 RepID=A0A849BYY4_9NOCA|nr:HNH endonuclease signature motif containing protein [Nocardia uniformis]NNH71722.1 HNH endonuclease [Nocardia uniformis]
MHSTPALIADPAMVAALSMLEAGLAELRAARTDNLSNPERLAVLQRVETVVRALPGIGLQVLAQLHEQWGAGDFATNSLIDTLADGLRISPIEARARWRASDDLAHHTDITGELLDPPMPDTAAAQCEGVIGGAHVKIIREALHHLPSTVDAETKTLAEAELAQHARTLRPDQLRKAADRLEAYLNPDGTFSDLDRARRRSLRVGKQGPDLMSVCTLIADPELRAYLDAMLAKAAKPGYGNPDDIAPCLEDEPDPDAVHRDRRTPAQRQHDALKAVLRDTLASGRLGQHRGLPVTVIVSTTLAELEAAGQEAVAETADATAPFATGVPVVTGGGSLLPMRDLLRMGAHARHYLAVFDNDGRPIYLGRSKRLGSVDQRIVLHARDIGCTFPGCGKPGYLCQAHHRTEWRSGGRTDADQLTLVCEPHHRLAGVTNTDWSAGAAPPGHRLAGRTQWIPPDYCDRQRRPRMNHFHHPGEYLTPAGHEGPHPTL